jgi:UDP-glucose 4-epimerase
VAIVNTSKAEPVTILPSTGAVLVTGISSFIGAYVVARLAKAGYDVVGLTHNSISAPDTAGLCSRIISGDVTEPRIMEKALDGVAAVCHLAAYRPADYHDPSEAARCIEVNALGTLELARAALRLGVRRIVYASASNAYVPGPEPAVEEHPVWPIGHAAWYLTSKIAAEFYLEQLRCTADLSPVILRIASCYGPGMGSRSVVARFVTCAQRGEPLDVLHGGRPTADFVHVLDVADCFGTALSAGEAGIYNVGSGCATTLLDLAQTAKTVFNSSAPVRIQPLAGPAPTGFPAVSIAKSAAAWGYAPMSLQSGLKTFTAAS